MKYEYTKSPANGMDWGSDYYSLLIIEKHAKYKKKPFL